VSLHKSRINDRTQQDKIYNKVVIIKQLLIYNNYLKRCGSIIYNYQFKQTKHSRASLPTDVVTVVTQKQQSGEQGFKWIAPSLQDCQSIKEWRKVETNLQDDCDAWGGGGAWCDARRTALNKPLHP
jgi:hypothetical protein